MYNTIHASLTTRIGTPLVAALCAAIALLAGALALENQRPAAAQTTADCEVTDLGTLSSEGEGELQASGRWTTEDCDSRFLPNSDAHTYRFELTEAVRVRIDLTSPDGDPYLHLLAADGGRIAHNDDRRRSGLDSRIERDLTPGVYLVEAAMGAGRARGPADFTLVIHADLECVPIDLGALESGEALTAEETWGPHACGARYREDAPAFTYRFELPEEGLVRIDVVSEEGDPYVYLLGADGSFIGSDDDSGTEFNARIENDLPAGTYLVEATTYRARDGVSSPDDFTLTISLVDESAYKLKVEALDIPDQIIAGQPFAVGYRVGNLGQSPLPADGSYARVYALGGRFGLDRTAPIPASPTRWQAGVSYHSGADTASTASIAIPEASPLELTLTEPGATQVLVVVAAFNPDDDEIGIHVLRQEVMVLTGPAFGPVTISIDDTDYIVAAIPSEGDEEGDGGEEGEEGDKAGTVVPEVSVAGDPEAEIDPALEAQAIYIAAVQEYLLAGIFERPLIAALGEPGEAAGEPVSLADLSSGTLLAAIGRQYADAVAASGLIEAFAAGELVSAVAAENLLLRSARPAADSYAASAAAWTALQARVAEGEGLTLDEALAVHAQLTHAEAVASPAATAGAVIRATRSAADGEQPAVAQWLTAELAARASCGAGPAQLRGALAAAGVADIAALLTLDDELRFASPLYGYATDAALCAAFGASGDVSRFMGQLGIDDTAVHFRLIPQPPPLPPVAAVAPETVRLRIIVQLAEDGRLEHGVEFADGQTFIPRKRFLETDAEVDRWKISTMIELDGEPVGRIRARRLADGRVEIGFRDANGVAITPDVRFVPADLRPGEWMRGSEFVAPVGNRAGQPAAGADSDMSEGPPRFPVTGGGGSQ